MSSVTKRRSLALWSLRRAPFIVVALAGCAQGPKAERPSELAVDVFSDTSRSLPLAATPRPEARVWIERVMPSGPRGGMDAALPDAPSAAPAWDQAPPPREGDTGLRPPILRRNAPLVLPRAGARGSVELEVRVDESGWVSDVRFAGGSEDSALVGAATRCARAMRFFPALLTERPIAVWCRQRFDFGAR